MTNSASKPRIDPSALSIWAKELIRRGFSPYLVTFQWGEMRGSEHTRLHRMNGALERFYSRTVTRFDRWPQRRPLTELPHMLAFPDLPCTKQEKKIHHPSGATNDGLHFHALFFVPPICRSTSSLTDLLNTQPRIWDDLFQTLHCVDITRTIDKVCAYVVKSEPRFEEFEWLVLPRGHREMFKRTFSSERPLETVLRDPQALWRTLAPELSNSGPYIPVSRRFRDYIDEFIEGIALGETIGWIRFDEVMQKPVNGFPGCVLSFGFGGFMMELRRRAAAEGFEYLPLDRAIYLLYESERKSSFPFLQMQLCELGFALQSTSQFEATFGCKARLEYDRSDSPSWHPL